MSEEYATIDRSNLDRKVWVPHIPDSMIAESEGCATTSLRRAKEYVESRMRIVVDAPKWTKQNDGFWVLTDESDV